MDRLSVLLGRGRGETQRRGERGEGTGGGERRRGGERRGDKLA
jgi:hypothetical protein